MLASTWLKSFFSIGKGASAERALPVGGALVGFFSTLVGATGPLLAPFILALELGAQSTIATLAACQIFQHASKVLLFGIRGFDLRGYLLPCLLLSLCAVAGSAIGTRLARPRPRKVLQDGRPHGADDTCRSSIVRRPQRPRELVVLQEICRVGATQKTRAQRGVKTDAPPAWRLNATERGLRAPRSQGPQPPPSTAKPTMRPTG